MSARKPDVKTYTRPMAGWWTRNPFFIRYMLREASALFLTLYALMLLFGLNALRQGPAPYRAWQDALTTPLSMLFHGAALVLVAYHAWTWFAVMPKTAPDMKLADAMLTRGALAASAVVSLAILGAVYGATR